MKRSGSKRASTRWRSHHRNTRWGELNRRHLAHRAPRGDPSRTTGIVRAYRADMNRRWAELQRVLFQMIARDDVLGLGPSPPRVVLQLQPPSRFSFPTDLEGKARAFEAWLRGALDSELLQLVGGSPTGWQNSYVRAAYSRGLQHADESLRAIGVEPLPESLAATFNAPIHSSKLRLLFSRNFTELKGITDAVSQSLTRIVTDGLATGQGPRELARRLTRSVRTIGRNRSLVLVRTEVINAHQEATLNRFEQSGVDKVIGFAEFQTAGDNRVCAECDSLETGDAIPLGAARGVIPVHPQCRCIWLPVLSLAAAA